MNIAVYFWSCIISLKEIQYIGSTRIKLKGDEYHSGQQNSSDHRGFLHLCSLEIICQAIKKWIELALFPSKTR